MLAMWESLEPVWGPAREVRPRQPLLAISAPPAVPPDPFVRRVQPSELDLLLPACVAMFTEEVGVSPVEGNAGPAYRERVRQIVSAGHAFARIERGRVLFKAEVGALAGDVAQIHGVWVHPEHRGSGLAAPGIAAVVAALLGEVRTVSLYVNDFNEPALRAYRRAGLQRVGEYSTVLF